MYYIAFVVCLILSLTSALPPNIKHKPNGLVGGRNPKFGEGKYIVIVKNPRSYCGGGIISEKHILTAAHCIKVNQTTGKLLNKMKIIANTHVVRGYTKSAVVERDVEKVYLPSVYKNDGVNDIAVLELKKPLQTIKHKLQKLNLPKPLSNDSCVYSTYEKARVEFAGYGNTHADIIRQGDGTFEIDASGAGQLHIANAVIDDPKTCLHTFEDIQKSQMCLSVVEDESKQNPQGTCTGDSGSPAVYDNDVVIGLDSMGVWCNNNWAPTLFTRVSSFIPFIKKAMKGTSDGLVVYDA